MRPLSQLVRSNPVTRLIRPYRRAILRELAARRFRPITDDDERRIAFYRQFVHPGDLVFDVGANLGNRSKAFLELGGEVVAFEPQKVCGDFLSTAFRGNKRFQLVRDAVGAQPGQATLHVSDVHFLSSLDEAWMDTMRESGRFPSGKWIGTETVGITTLDTAIERFGVPSFVKIDVEGFETQVISGLSRPLKMISLEFTAERIKDTVACIERLEALGPVEGQLSHGESLVLALPNWVTAAALKAELRALEKNAVGDIYLRSTC